MSTVNIVTSDFTTEQLYFITQVNNKMDTECIFSLHCMCESVMFVSSAVEEEGSFPSFSGQQPQTMGWVMSAKLFLKLL